jgi:hypothetical protein
MTMSDPFADERIQFFLRNREDIKTWAAIERDVVDATRELLARAQPRMEDRLLDIDPNTIVGRHDSGQWERILARHEHWPGAVGLALEWHRMVDPLGANRPKLGVFWWADPRSLIEPRTRLVSLVDRKRLQGLGYKVPLEGVWPVGSYMTSAPDWWEAPDAWVETMIDRLAETWPLVAPMIDEALVGVDWQVTGG